MKPTYALLLLGFVLLLFSCQFNRDKEFQVFFEGFQQKVKEEPLMRAFIEKQLAFDSILIVFNHKDVDSLLRYANERLNELELYPNERLSPDLYSYSQNTGDFLKLMVKHIGVDQVHHTDPSFYNPQARLNYLLEQGTLTEWATALQGVTENYNTATQILQQADTLQSRLAEQQGLNVYKILSSIDLKKITSSATSAQKVALEDKLQQAKLASKSFIGLANSLGYESREAIARQSASPSE